MSERLDLVIVNGTVLTAARRRQADVAIRDGRIHALGERHEFDESAAELLDAGGLFVLPGVIDGHVHFREPGLEHKETWLTGSRAAVHGGVTTVLEMPNTVPPTRSVADALAKLELAAASSYCDFGIFGLVDPPSIAGLPELLESGLIVGLKVFLAPSTGGIAAPTDEQLLRALALARAVGMRTAFHAEDGRTIQASGGARPIEAEVRAIDHAAGMLSRSGAAGHILHLSSEAGIEAVRRWRARGVDLTCEVTPHHLLLRSPDEAKVYPPLRGEPHTEALMAALMDGTIDCVASDHAPHSPAEKSGPDPSRLAAGAPGVETMLPLMLTLVDAGRLSLERMVAVTSEGPARTWGLWPAKGSLDPGADADLVVVELASEGVIRGAELHGMHPMTPFEGRVIHGRAIATLVRGQVVAGGEQPRGAPGWGRPVSRQSPS
jgi:dihydroorotase